MTGFDAKDLEGISGSKEKREVSPMNEGEEIGFHKGALNTLVAERNELVKMVSNVEAIMKAHISRLKELGVNLDEPKSKRLIVAGVSGGLGGALGSVSGSNSWIVVAIVSAFFAMVIAWGINSFFKP